MASPYPSASPPRPRFSRPEWSRIRPRPHRRPGDSLPAGPEPDSADPDGRPNSCGYSASASANTRPSRRRDGNRRRPASVIDGSIDMAARTTSAPSPPAGRVKACVLTCSRSRRDQLALADPHASHLVAAHAVARDVHRDRRPRELVATPRVGPRKPRVQTASDVHHDVRLWPERGGDRRDLGDDVEVGEFDGDRPHRDDLADGVALVAPAGLRVVDVLNDRDRGRRDLERDGRWDARR